jgi:Uma2 family endonuclease
MSSQPQHRYTLEEYFDLDFCSEEKYEYWDGQVFCMTGASLSHNQISRNILTRLDAQLPEKGCHVLPSDMRVKVPAYPPYRYPDLTALCGRPEVETMGGLEVLTNPALIVEVLSPSTEAFDRGDKFTYYQSIQTFTEYLLVAQHRPHVSQFVRQEGGVWAFREFNDLSEEVSCAAVPGVLKLSEIYRDVDFEATAAEPPDPDADAPADRG